MSTTSKYSDAEMTKVMAEKDNRPAQLKYDKSKSPSLSPELLTPKEEKEFDCVRIRCPMNDTGKKCRAAPSVWTICRRQIEP